MSGLARDFAGVGSRRSRALLRRTIRRRGGGRTSGTHPDQGSVVAQFANLFVIFRIAHGIDPFSYLRC